MVVVFSVIFTINVLQITDTEEIPVEKAAVGGWTVFFFLRHLFFLCSGGWTSGQIEDQKSTRNTLLRTERVFLPVVAVIASCFYTAIALTYYVELL